MTGGGGFVPVTLPMTTSPDTRVVNDVDDDHKRLVRLFTMALTLVGVHRQICSPGGSPGRRPTLDARDVAILWYSTGCLPAASAAAGQ